MLKIRLARVGKKKKPTYRFIVSESTKDTFGRALEILGHYNPFSKVIEINKERTLYWISKGAQASPTVHNILVDQNVIQAEKVKASKAGKKEKEQAAAEPKPQAKGAEAEKEVKPSKEKPASEKASAKSEEKPKELIEKPKPEETAAVKSAQGNK